MKIPCKNIGDNFICKNTNKICINCLNYEPKIETKNNTKEPLVIENNKGHK